MFHYLYAQNLTAFAIILLGASFCLTIFHTVLRSHKAERIFISLCTVSYIALIIYVTLFFREKSETALLEALMLYLYHYAPENEQNFTMVMEMLTYADVHEDDESYESPLDELFKQLERTDPGSLALKQYQIYKQAAGVIR